MKTSKFILTLAAVAAVAASCAVHAQTNTVPATNSAPASTTTTGTISGGLTEIYDALSTSGLATATNYAFEPYLTYAPSAPSGNQIGGGVFACYNVSKFVGTGLGLDYLGQFSLVSANVQIKIPTHPLAFIGTGWATNLVVAPFALAGVGTPLNGSGNGAIAVTDAGAYVQFGALWGGKFNTGVAYGKWSGAPTGYGGSRYHLFVGWSKGF